MSAEAKSFNLGSLFGSLTFAMTCVSLHMDTHTHMHTHEVWPREENLIIYYYFYLSFTATCIVKNKASKVVSLHLNYQNIKNMI